MNGRIAKAALTALTIGGLSAIGLAASGGTAAAASKTIYVSPVAKSTAKGTSCPTAKYSFIQQAVAAAPKGGTVIICDGTYTMANQNVKPFTPMVVIDKSLTFLGQSATIDGSGGTPGTGALIDIAITASHVTVSGFTLTGAVDEGVVALPDAALKSPGEFPAKPSSPLTHITITGNLVNGVDRGFVSPNGCVLAFEYFGDCGGGIHFNAVAYSTISHNTVTDNAEGILITDDAGPADHNTISNNQTINNPIECGIVLPSHNSRAASVKFNPNGTYTITRLNPKKAGVYDNLVENNISLNNGTAGFRGNTAGSGSGYLIAAAGPGTASYNNVIKNNIAHGNGLAGVVIHGHYVGGVYVGGNKITGNTLGLNNTGGDQLDSPWTPMDTASTGILIESAGRITMTVSGNHISDDGIGIWHNKAVTLKGSNTFSNTGTKVYAPSVPFGSAWCAPVNFFPQVCPPAKNGTATLYGFAVPNGSKTTSYFRYGTKKNDLTKKTAVQNDGKGVKIVGQTANLKNLKSKTTYYFELVVKNAQGTTTGSELSFTTT